MMRPAVSVLLALSACSFVGVTPPTPERPRDCRPSNNTLPAIDTAAAVGGLGLASFLFFLTKPTITSDGIGGAAAATGAIYGASAIYGFRGVHACQAAWAN